MADINRLVNTSAELAHRVAFLAISGTVLLSPWAFGAWEMWWFWPLATVLFAGVLLAGVGTLLRTAFTQDGETREDRRVYEGRLALLLAALAPFLVYVLWRFRTGGTPDDPLVHMEAERGVLLFVTPVLLGIGLFLSGSQGRLRCLLRLFVLNGLLLALYALANHWITGNDYVLWVRSPYLYGLRAVGPFFCPNHLAAYLNLALCVVLALWLTPGVPGRLRGMALVAAAPMLLAWFLTLSRGGVGSLLLTLPVVVTAGLRGRRWGVRIGVGGGLLAAAVVGVWALFNVPNPLLVRFERHQFTQAVLNVRSTGWEPVRESFFTRFDRGIYISSALRAWRSSPTWGIGPGQHPVRWPEFAATADGNRETGEWPSQTHHEYHLYEVHSDWVQLLEEYGLVGMALFLPPFLLVLAMLYRAQGRGLRSAEGASVGPEDTALSLAALLAAGALAVHSVGDFSLQIPAITWGLAMLVAGGLYATLPTRLELGS